MTFELYQNTCGSRGSLAEVWIDERSGIVKKIYKPNGITIRGCPPMHSDQATITMLFENEIKYGTEMIGQHFIKLLDYGSLKDEFGYWILQEYVGPDLLWHYSKDTKLQHILPDAADQIYEIYTIFREHNIYKLNMAMANLTHHNGVVKAFDFKYTVPRSPEMRPFEVHAINSWMRKIDIGLPERLLTIV